jgi:RimJ/RimL family protein N-acetyltransferase
MTHNKINAALPCAFEGGMLRRLQSSDLAAFQAYRAIPELGRFQGWSPLSDSDAQAFIHEMADAPLFSPGNWVQLGIADPASNRLLGDIGLYVADDERSAEVGFTLKPAAQGRGVATAAVRAALTLLFSVTNVQEVLGVTDVRNLASSRLLERVGFEHKETCRAAFRGEACMEATYVFHRSLS